MEISQNNEYGVIIVRIGNIIFGAMTKEREVDWALVIWDIVKRLYKAIGKSKALPLYSYLFHLYITHETILPEDRKVYMIGESMLKHNVEPDEEDLVGSEDLEWESLDDDEIGELQAQQEKKLSPTCRK